ncbi:hypothetical protein HanIR_Chr09g0413171 [Helianthus annuus]|nr:hypothetical protein HanIR_Chr09g0413171 [Helianthus annuus]
MGFNAHVNVDDLHIISGGQSSGAVEAVLTSFYHVIKNASNTLLFLLFIFIQNRDDYIHMISKLQNFSSF